MTMQAMVDFLENKGFKATKKYNPLVKKYEFSISKDDKNFSMAFEYPAGDSPSTKDKKQRLFLDTIIERFKKEFEDAESLYPKTMVAAMEYPSTMLATDIINRVIKAKEKEMSNNIEWRVKEVTLDRRFGETSVFGAHIEGTMNGVVVGDLNDISNKLQKKLNEPEKRINSDTVYEYILNDIRLAYAAKDAINRRFGTNKLPNIKKVIFNNPATIVMWADETKTVVKAQNNEIFDPEKGLAMAITKKALGNEGNYFEVIKKYTSEYESESLKYAKIGGAVADGFAKALDNLRNLNKRLKDAQKEKEEHDAKWMAYQRLQNALHDRKATKADLIIAMEEACGYLGEVLE